MTITETLASAAAAVIPKKGPVKYPEQKTKAPVVMKQLDEATAVMAELMRRYPELALKTALDEPAADEAFRKLKDQIAEAEKRIADLTAAMTAAEAHDAALIRRTRVALHRNTVLGIKKYLARRDEAAAKFSIAIENAVAAYRDMVDVAGKAAGQVRHLANDESFMAGWRLDTDELYRSATAEIMRLSVPWPIRSENAELPPFPYDRSAATTLFDRAEVKPLVDDLRRRSGELIEALAGKEPSAD